eukprot:scaffold270091_cov49-Attheya_sp.AAC.1
MSQVLTAPRYALILMGLNQKIGGMLHTGSLLSQDRVASGYYLVSRPTVERLQFVSCLYYYRYLYRYQPTPACWYRRHPPVDLEATDGTNTASVAEKSDQALCSNLRSLCYKY